MLALTPDDNNGGEIAPTEEMQDLLTHWYTIKEVNEAKDGITYDPTVYTVCVKLQDKKGNGKLDIESITYYQADKTTPLGGSRNADFPQQLCRSGFRRSNRYPAKEPDRSCSGRRRIYL